MAARLAIAIKVLDLCDRGIGLCDSKIGDSKIGDSEIGDSEIGDSKIGDSEASNSNGSSINSIVGGSRARICRALSQYADDDAQYGFGNSFIFGW